MFQMIQVYISTHSYCKQSLVFSDFHLEFYRFVWDNEFVIHLFYPTKNDKSRTIALSNFVLTALHRAHRRKLENKLLYGPAWEDSGFVFTDELGHHLKHQTVYLEFKKIVTEIGAPNARFHDLRHSFAVSSIRAGDDIKTVQEHLGHATAAFTLDIYGHVTDQMHKESAVRMDRFIENVLTG